MISVLHPRDVSTNARLAAELGRRHGAYCPKCCMLVGWSTAQRGRTLCWKCAPEAWAGKQEHRAKGV